MILLLKYFTKRTNLNTSTIIIYSILLLCTAFINYLFVLFFIIADIYTYMILTEFKFNINPSKTKTNIKMEIVAEGTRKAETNNLANILIDYNDKFNN